VRRVTLLIALAVLAGSSTSAVSDTSTRLGDASVPDNEMSDSQAEASNSSTSATITMTGVLDE
jgi:hypothetical protein